jgi:membrane protease YdiL (CAAX protease family)
LWLDILKIAVVGGILGFIVGKLIVQRPYYLERLRPKFWMRIAKKMKREDWIRLVTVSIVITALIYLVTTYSAELTSRVWALYSPEEYWAAQLEASAPILLLIIATLIPVIEEWVFRGILLEEFSRRFRSRAVGVVLSAIVFALFHLSNPGTYPAAALPLFLGGLLLGGCYLLAGLSAATACHCAYNFLLALPAVVGI